ncbi:hypothetical protein HZS_6168, partial [Henneguya salminicola]
MIRSIVVQDFFKQDSKILKGIHVCSEIAAIIIPSEKFDVEPE